MAFLRKVARHFLDRHHRHVTGERMAARTEMAIVCGALRPVNSGVMTGDCQGPRDSVKLPAPPARHVSLGTPPRAGVRRPSRRSACGRTRQLQTPPSAALLTRVNAAASVSGAGHRRSRATPHPGREHGRAAPAPLARGDAYWHSRSHPLLPRRHRVPEPGPGAPSSRRPSAVHALLLHCRRNSGRRCSPLAPSDRFTSL